MTKDTLNNGFRLPLSRRTFLQGAAATAAIPAIGTLTQGARADDAVELTLWAWTPHTQDVINRFMQKNPNIKVNYQNVGQGAPHYQKLRDALTAGTGAPDVAQMEFNSISSFRALKGLADLGPLLPPNVKDRFVDWTWKAVSDGNSVYGVPWDSGPMGMLYRQDVFDSAGLKAPATWDEFADQAMTLAQKTPGKFYTNFGASDGGWICATLAQKGWRPFKLDGTNLQIAINDQIAKDWANYWQKLVDAKAVSTRPLWTADFFTDFDNGTTASWITAAWGPALISGSMKNSVGKWRAAGMPQWKAGDKVDSNWGGSTMAVMAPSQHQKEAAMLAAYVASDPDEARFWNQTVFLFPVEKALLSDAALMGTKYDFYGGQPVNQVFAEMASEVDPSFQFAPFQDNVNSHLQDEFAAALGGNGKIADAFDRVQDAIVAYAKDQGYTVS